MDYEAAFKLKKDYISWLCLFEYQYKETTQPCVPDASQLQYQYQ